MSDGFSHKVSERVSCLSMTSLTGTIIDAPRVDVTNEVRNRLGIKVENHLYLPKEPTYFSLYSFFFFLIPAALFSTLPFSFFTITEYWASLYLSHLPFPFPNLQAWTPIAYAIVEMYFQYFNALMVVPTFPISFRLTPTLKVTVTIVAMDKSAGDWFKR